MAEKDVARAADLESHIKSDWKLAHGIWTQVKNYIDAEGLVQIATPTDITASFTWDGSQHTLDLTSATAATARWAIVSYYIHRDGGDSISPLKFRAVGGSTDYIQLCGDMHQIDETDGSVFESRHGIGGEWIPLDSAQQVDYIAPAAYTSKVVYLLGYYKCRA